MFGVQGAIQTTGPLAGSRGRAPHGGQGAMPPEAEEMSFRSQICCFLAQKKHHGFCFFVVKFLFLFIHFLGQFSSRGNPRYRGKEYWLYSPRQVLMDFPSLVFLFSKASVNGFSFSGFLILQGKC